MGNIIFWSKWLESDEIERHKIVAELIKEVQLDKLPINASLLNSYFEDLEECIKLQKDNGGSCL